MEVAERLIEEYEGRVDFVAWFADMELEDLIELLDNSIQVSTTREVDGVYVAAGHGQFNSVLP